MCRRVPTTTRNIPISTTSTSSTGAPTRRTGRPGRSASEGPARPGGRAGLGSGVGPGTAAGPVPAWPAGTERGRLSGGLAHRSTDHRSTGYRLGPGRRLPGSERGRRAQPAAGPAGSGRSPAGSAAGVHRLVGLQVLDGLLGRPRAAAACARAARCACGHPDEASAAAWLASRRRSAGPCRRRRASRPAGQHPPGRAGRLTRRPGRLLGLGPRLAAVLVGCQLRRSRLGRRLCHCSWPRQQPWPVRRLGLGGGLRPAALALRRPWPWQRPSPWLAVLAWRRPWPCAAALRLGSGLRGGLGVGSSLRGGLDGAAACCLPAVGCPAAEPVECVDLPAAECELAGRRAG